MKRKKILIILLLLIFTITGCEEESGSKIKMSKSSDSYLKENWTYESLKEHFKKLGFTNIKGIAVEPEDDDFEKNIFELYIEQGFIGDDTWEKNDEFNSNQEVRIFYNEYPLMTIDNSEDLKKVLNGKIKSYEDFAKKYDGRYVEFKAIVHDHHSLYDTMDMIYVVGENKNGLIIQIGDNAYGNNIDLSVEKGDKVIVRGRISKSDSDYYKNLYVETLDLIKQ